MDGGADKFCFYNGIQFCIDKVEISFTIPFADIAFYDGEPGYTIKTAVDLIVNGNGTGTMIETGCDAVKRAFCIEFDLNPSIACTGMPVGTDFAVLSPARGVHSVTAVGIRFDGSTMDQGIDACDISFVVVVEIGRFLFTHQIMDHFIR